MQVFLHKQAGQAQDYSWYLGSEASISFERFTGSLEQLAEFAKEYQQVKQWVLLLPGIDCIDKTLSFEEQERKHILKALPYLLEENLLSDVDELHLVADKPEKSSVHVVGIDQQVLQKSLDELEQIGISLSACLPEQCLLSNIQQNTDESWQLLQLPNYLLMGIQGEFFAVENEHAGLAFDLLQVKFEAQAPTQLLAFAESDAELEQLERLLASLPESIQAITQIERFNYPELAANTLQSQVLLQRYNLLKGAFARTVNWLQLVKPWRSVLIALLAIYVLQLSLMWFESNQLAERFEQQQAQKDELFRKVIPRGNIVDHQKQLERELAKLEGGGRGQVFIEWLEQAGKALADAKVQDVNSIQYEAKTSMLRLDFLVADYDSLQAIIANLKGQGFEVEIQNSNAQDDKLRARLNVQR